MQLETERLILRPLRLADEDNLLEYQSHPEVVRYIPWPERTRSQVREALEKAEANQAEALVEENDTILLAWQLKTTGKVIGQSNLTLRSKIDQMAEIGYVTHQDFQHQGFAYEATSALMKHAFSSYAIHRIIANIDTRAVHSGALARKLGMRLEGTFIESEFFKGEWVNMWLYAILATEN
jgi:aminoglycoside 6'-N-acetyltransferase